jgi:hypothetical protein
MLKSSVASYESMTIVNDDPRAINRLEASLTDDAGVIIYDRQMFIVQATGVCWTSFCQLFKMKAT